MEIWSNLDIIEGVAKSAHYKEVSLYRGSFPYIVYFAITGAKKIVRYTEDFVIIIQVLSLHPGSTARETGSKKTETGNGS